MSNIPNLKQKIQIESTYDRRPTIQNLFQSIGGSINYLIDATQDLNIQKDEFLSSGFWLCPDNVTKILIFACGGGGGGCSADVVTTSANRLFALFGGEGASLCQRYIDVVPGNIYNITIGAGGSFNNPGGNTTFNFGSSNLFTAQGGIAGGYTFEITAAGNPPKALDIKAQNGFSPGNIYDASYSNLSFTKVISIYGGSAGPFGNGADAGFSAAANTGAGGGASELYGYAGAGGSGKLIIIYV